MKTVFFDVDTQIDFMYPAGALYVPGAEAIVPKIADLNRHAASHDISVVSTVDAHAEDDPEFAEWPPHCIIGTAGQKKPTATLLEKGQIILEKQSVNCFTSPRLPGLLQELAADRYVVYGVVTEICVKNAAGGLLKTGKRVEIVADAVRHLSESRRDAFLAEFKAAGGVLTTAQEVLSGH